MKLFARFSIVIAALTLGLATYAQDKSDILDATDPKRIAEAIQDLGYRAKLEVDSDDTATILSSVGGTEFIIQFLACDNGNLDCRVLLFKVGYDLSAGTTQEVVEEWNETTLIGRAWRDEEEDPWLEYAVNLYGGVTRENFEDTFDWWEIIVGQFENYIDF